MPKFDTAHGKVVDLLQQTKTYQVPDYQRQYSWKPGKQIAELWRDISSLYVIERDEGSSEGTFIGSIVTGEGSAKALGPTDVPIIDGQQRLITLSLIVAAIRDELVPDATDQKEISKQYLLHYRGENDREPKVTPGVADRDDFTKIMKGLKPSKGSAVTRAYNYVCDQIRSGPDLPSDPDADVDIEFSDLDVDVEESDQPPVDDLTISIKPADMWDWQTLLAVVGTRLEIISITNVPVTSAYQVFASLNSTGLPLSQVDLVRNAVYMLLPTHGDSASKSYWRPMDDHLAREGLQGHLHTWAVRRGHNVPGKEMYRVVLKELQRPTSSESVVLGNLRDLYEQAWSYSLVTRPRATVAREQFFEKDAPKLVVEAFERLAEWGNTPLQPVLVELAERWRTNELTTKELLEQLALVESFVVRRFIAQIPPNDLRSSFARLAIDMTRASDSVDLRSRLLSGLMEQNRRWPSNTQLKKALENEPLYQRSKLRQGGFVLKRIAEELQGKETPTIEFGTSAASFSVEHVMPQSTNSGKLSAAWREDMTAWGDPDPDETYELYLHTIGNLTLTAYNSELSNLRFNTTDGSPSKRAWIKDKLSLSLSKKVAESEQWTRSEILGRSAELSQVAIKIWPRPEAG